MKKLIARIAFVVTFILLGCSYQASTESKKGFFELVDTKGNCRIYKANDGHSVVYFCECDYKYNCSISR